MAPPGALLALFFHTFVRRVGQNRIYTYIYAVYLVISLPKIPYINRIYMVLANPIYVMSVADTDEDGPPGRTSCTVFSYFCL